MRAPSTCQNSGDATSAINYPGPCGFAAGSVRGFRYGLPFEVLAALWSYNDGIPVTDFE
jgi:hypothetical protein